MILHCEFQFGTILFIRNSDFERTNSKSMLINNPHAKLTSQSILRKSLPRRTAHPVAVCNSLPPSNHKENLLVLVYGRSFIYHVHFFFFHLNFSW